MDFGLYSTKAPSATRAVNFKMWTWSDLQGESQVEGRFKVTKMQLPLGCFRVLKFHVCFDWLLEKLSNCTSAL